MKKNGKKYATTERAGTVLIIVDAKYNDNRVSEMVGLRWRLQQVYPIHCTDNTKNIVKLPGLGWC